MTKPRVPSPLASVANRLAGLPVVKRITGRSLRGKTFILGVGAMKAGTSWLNSYLDGCPDVMCSPLKEVHFFDAKFPGLLDPGLHHRRAFDKVMKHMDGDADVLDRLKRRPRFRASVDRLQMIYDDNAYVDHFARLLRKTTRAVGETTPAYAVLPREGFEFARNFLGSHGLKVRVVGSPMYGEIMSGMGANPTFMSWADAQPALASGAVDAQENPLEVFLAAKINTLGQKYVTKWNYSNDILLFAIAQPVWSQWTAADQKIVREAAQDAAKQQVAIVRKLFAEDVERVRALGVEVHIPTAAEQQAWQIATRRIYARWKVGTHAGLVSKIEQVAEKARGKA